MNLICNVDMNWGIGKGNSLLFPIPEDLKFFRSMTIERNVICGKKTLYSFPGSKPLPRRRHYVLTHSNLPETEDLVCVHSLSDLFCKICNLSPDSLFVIGGESVYRQLYQYCDFAYITKVLAKDDEAEQFFPNLDQNESFALIEEGNVQTSTNGLKFRFCKYKNLFPLELPR